MKNLCAQQAGEQLGRCRADHRQYGEEILLTAIIRIRHRVAAVMAMRMRQVQGDFGRRIGRCQALKRFQMRLVHRQDQIEIIEIRGFHVARAQIAHVDAGILQHPRAARIGPLADMVRIHPGRIMAELRFKPAFLDGMAEIGFGGGGTADIARADEENRFFLIHCFHFSRKSGEFPVIPRPNAAGAAPALSQRELSRRMRDRRATKVFMDAIIALRTRRSVKPKELSPGRPTAEELQTILTIATRVPDHGKLTPWRIVILEGEGQKKLGRIAAEQFMQLNPEANDANREFEAARFTRAPLVLCVISTPIESIKAPRWEQELSAGAVCTNILQACHALGYGASWLTEWPAYNPAVASAIGCGIDDRIAGFIYIGGPVQTPPADRERPNLSDVVRAS